MKHRLVLLFLIACTVCPAQLLWKISGNGLKTPSYLFGTHHLVPLSLIDTIPHLYPTFNTCDNIVSEIIVDDPSVIRKIAEASVTTTTIYELLSPQQCAIADSILLSTLQIGLTTLKNLKPTMIENLYLLSLYEKEFAIDHDFQMDTYFQKVAKYNGKQLYTLETIDEQINLLFYNTPLQKQADNLYTTLTSDSIISQIHQINTLYKQGNLDALLTLTIQTDLDNEELIEKRNQLWAERLPVILKTGKCFIAVGALHLPGKKGLIQLLRDKKYKVKAVK